MTAPTARLFGIEFACVDYEEASARIIDAARERRSYGVSALAVHGLMEATGNSELADRINRIDLVVPDGQPVRWALNDLHGAGLPDRVAGPELTLWVLRKADAEGLGVYLFGSTPGTAEKFAAFIRNTYPNVRICGVQPDRFRDATPQEDLDDIATINASGANIVLVGRGCPRQEVWVADHLGKVDAAMMAIGAAFDFHAGNIRPAPNWIQRAGLEWLFRLIQEPRRLFRRYLTTNSAFVLRYLKCRWSPGRNRGS